VSDRSESGGGGGSGGEEKNDQILGERLFSIEGVSSSQTTIQERESVWSSR
jgi:hypothetical protein